MTSRSIPCILATLVVLASATPAHAALDYRGVQVETVDPAASFDASAARAASTGANLVRFEVPWHQLEPAPGVYSAAMLAATDRAVDAATARGLKVLMLVDSSPCWASDAPASVKGDCSTASQRSAASTYGPADPSRYGVVAAMLTARYGSRLAAFEVWNEPDQANQLYLNGPDKAARYARILKAAYPAIKAVAPATPVIGASIVGSNGLFLQALYAQGIKGYYDGLSVHFYDETLSSLRSIRDVQKRNGDSAPLWLAEFGYSSCYPALRIQTGQICVTRQMQATRTGDVLRGLRKQPYVKAAVVYQVSDNNEYDLGIFDKSGARKPLFGVLSALWHRKTVPSPRNVRLRLSRSGGSVLATGSGPGGDFYLLQAFTGGRLSYQAIVKLDRNLRFRVKLPRALGNRGVKLRMKYLSGRSVTRSI